MGAPEKYTDEQIVEAIIKAEGIITEAAKLLGCSRMTLYRRCKDNPVVDTALETVKDVQKEQFMKIGFQTAKDRNHPQFFQFHRYYGRVKFGLTENQVDITSGGDRIEGFKVILPDPDDA